MRRGLLPLATTVLSLALVPAATADKPSRETGPQPDRTVSGQCAFLVLGHIDGDEVVTTFTNRAGDPIKQISIFPANKLTLTNLESGRSITVVSTGPSMAKIERDGSGFFQSTGHGPSFPNPVSGEPGIWYSSGRLRLTFDASMNATSVESTGRLVNLCDELAV
jgi:hypothetical protein